MMSFIVSVQENYNSSVDYKLKDQGKLPIPLCNLTYELYQHVICIISSIFTKLKHFYDISGLLAIKLC